MRLSTLLGSAAAVALLAQPVLAQQASEDTVPASGEGQFIIEQGAPDVTVDVPDPEVTVDQAQPIVTVEQPAPEVTVTQSPPQVNVQQQAPIITVEQAQPTVTVNIPEPVVTIQMPEPDVQVSQDDPSVQVQQPEPVVRFQRPEPRVVIEEAEPQVRISEAEPDVTVDAAEQAQVRMSQGEAEVSGAGRRAGRRVSQADPEIRSSPPERPMSMCNRPRRMSWCGKARPGRTRRRPGRRCPACRRVKATRSSTAAS
jgi:hypothetical protein